MSRLGSLVVVVPLESAFLTTGEGTIRNVFTQDVCPTDVYEHLAVGTVSPAAYALAVEALSHDGPADPAGVSRASCLAAFHPGVNPVTGPISAARAVVSFQSFTPRRLAAEPAPACYTTLAGCARRRRASGRPVTLTRRYRSCPR